MQLPVHLKAAAHQVIGIILGASVVRAVLADAEVPERAPSAWVHRPRADRVCLRAHGLIVVVPTDLLPVVAGPCAFALQRP